MAKAKVRRHVKVTVKIMVNERRFIEFSGPLHFQGLAPEEVNLLLWQMERRFNTRVLGTSTLPVEVAMAERMHVSVE